MSFPSRTRSRYNSPFGPGLPYHADRPMPKNTASETKADGERPKTLLEQWIEPSLAPPRPSFAEAGIERHGVVQNMAALGALPTAKVIKAAATAVDTGGRGAAGKKTPPSASTPGESNPTANATPEPPTIPSRPGSSHAKTEESTPAPTQAPTKAPTPTPAAGSTTVPAPLPAPISVPTPPSAPGSLSVATTPTFLTTNVPQAPPHTPQQQISPRRYVPPPSAMQQKMGQGVFALSRPQSMPYPVAPPAPPVVHQLPRYQQPNGDFMNIEFTDRVVESAVRQATDQHRWTTAYALRTLYDDFSQTNPRIVRLIDSIYSQTAGPEQIQEFKNVMRHKKKEGKKDGTAVYYFCGDGSDPLPQAHSSTANAHASTYSTPSARSGSAARTMSDAQARRSSFAFSSVSASPHKENEQHISKRHKGNNFPASNLEMNGTASAENGVKIRTPQKQPHGQQNGTSNPAGRRRSVSTSSSLSSVDEQVLDGGEYTASTGESSGIPQDSPRKAAGRASGIGGVAARTQAHHRATPPYANANSSASAETHAHSEARNQPGPITAPTAKGPKTYTFSTVTTSPSLSSSTNNNANAANAGHRPNSSANNPMAPAALLPSALFSSTSYQPPPSIVFKTKKDLTKASARPSIDENDSTTGRMKRDARKVTEKNTSTAESFERGRKRHQISLPLLPEFESASDGGESVAPKRGTKLRLLNNKKKVTRQTPVNYDSDSLSSPTALSFAMDIAPGSLSVSRAGTPNALSRPTRKAKPGTGLRVKTSPMKKKGGGTLAGIPRASGERNSPVGNGVSSNNQDENDDYCSACGGNGELVCCDGCTRAFHYKCVDPPMREEALPDSWFCNVCDSKVNPHMVDDERGSFGLLLAHLHRKNPSAFHLPKHIREFFENVKTGAEGEYEEPTQPKAKNRAGYDEAPDYFRLKDSKGKTILCHLCHGTASSPDRAIIPCTYCGLYWHLDCLDTPMAKEPAPGRPFRCPAHIDDLLTAIPGNLGPAHRRRKIKGASVIKPAISRGIVNNGDIEIENDPTDDEEELGFYEQREFGHTYKLPELGIKLDFISQVRQNTGGGFAPARLISHKPAPPRKASPDWNVRSIQEKQAALNLTALGMAPESGDVNSLVNALMAQAPPAVVAMIAQADAGKLAQGNVGDDRERNSLLALKALIESKLATSTPQPEHEAEQVATPTSTAAEKVKDETPATVEDDDVEMTL